jgi:uncharacterized protein YbjT (DUF2867 family)
MLRLLIVAATGGLGSNLVKEALSRGHRVSVLARDESKLASLLGAAEFGRLAAVHIGSAEDASFVEKAMADIDVVLSGAPAMPTIASTLSAAVLTTGARKLVWVAGASNMVEEDGVTLHHLKFGPTGVNYYNAHAPCIEAIKSSGANHVIFCPGLMRPAGAKSPTPPEIFTRCKPGQVDFVSYEDAAWAMVQVAEVDTFDGQQCEAITEQQGKAEL